MKHIASIASGGLFPLYNTALNENVSGMHGQLFIHYIPAMCPCKKLAANNIGHFRDSKDYHLQKELYSDGKKLQQIIVPSHRCGSNPLQYLDGGQPPPLVSWGGFASSGSPIASHAFHKASSQPFNILCSHSFTWCYTFTYHGIQVDRVKNSVGVLCHPLLPRTLEIFRILLFYFSESDGKM